MNKLIKLKDLRAGAIFETIDGTVAVKSEYRYSNDPQSQSQCMLLESGEYAHFPIVEMIHLCKK